MFRYNYINEKKGIKMRIKRDGNILKSLQREISLNSRVVKSKKVYSRKQKHKVDY